MLLKQLHENSADQAFISRLLCLVYAAKEILVTLVIGPSLTEGFKEFECCTGD